MEFYETGKNAVDVCTKAMIRCEEDILRYKMRCLQPGCNKPITTTIQTEGMLRWQGSMMGLVELVCALYYSGSVVDAFGERISFAVIVGAFSRLFCFPVDRPYDMRARLAQRKKRISVLLPEIKAAYEKNIVNCGIDDK